MINEPNNDGWVEVFRYAEPTFTSPMDGSVHVHFDPNSWGIHRRNKTSGKSRWGSTLTGMGEYFAKTLCNDANAGSRCFRYRVVAPDGRVLELRKQPSERAA